jgi:hypothetical protein
MARTDTSASAPANDRHAMARISLPPAAHNRHSGRIHNRKTPPRPARMPGVAATARNPLPALSDGDIPLFHRLHWQNRPWY